MSFLANDRYSESPRVVWKLDGWFEWGWGGVLVCMFDVVGESLQGGISKFDQDDVFIMGIFSIWEA